MSLLVIGGTGTIGGGVVQGLLSKGVNVKVLTRSAEKAKALPKGVVGAIGQLSDPASLSAAMQGVEKLFLLTPLSPTEGQDGVTAVKAAKQAVVVQ